MTANRDLKRRVRERQARTGESYMTALQHVRALVAGSASPVISTVEYIDVTEAAQRLGLRCRVTMSPATVRAVDVEQTLQRFRDALIAPRDPALWIMRTVALRGVHVPINLSPTLLRFAEQARARLGEHGRTLALRVESARFIDQARKGKIGVSDHGCMVALPATPRPARRDATPTEAAPDDPVAVFSMWQTPAFAVPAIRTPLVLVMSLDDYAVEPILKLIRRSPLP